MRPCYKREQGFTLIETALALVVAGILSTSATAIFVNVANKAQSTADRAVQSRVQTGVSLQQMNNVIMQGNPTFPAMLDSAGIGTISTGANPFFNNVLHFPVTIGWQKTAENTYLSPSGEEYVYNPENGSFTGGKETEGNGSEEGGSELPDLGKKVYSYAGFEFYDSGAIVDTLSNMAYVPDTGENKTVDLTLGSGTKVNTADDGSALVTLPNGETLTVADTHKPNYFQINDQLNKENEYGYEYLYIQGKSASEGKHTTTYDKKEYEADSKGGKYHYEYNSGGEYSGGSLDSEVGYLYKTEYQTKKPQTSEGWWEKTDKGDIRGSMKHTFGYTTTARYGYSKEDAEFRYAYEMEGNSEGWSEQDYEYLAEEEVQKNKVKGNQKYMTDLESSSGDRKTDVEYDYEGESKYDKKNKTYESEMHYEYGDGRDLTYIYAYDYKDKTYKWTVVDNKTGKKTTQTNREEEKEVKEEKKTEQKKEEGHK